MPPPPHRPVMPAEVLEALAPQAKEIYADGTLGVGGHSALVLQSAGAGAQLLGLDRDFRALEVAGARLKPFGSRVRLVQTTFDQMGKELEAWGRGSARGILLDLGVSSMQLDEPQRGFAFRHNAPLDMGMGINRLNAATLVASLDQKALARLFRELGEEALAKLLARAIVQQRQREPITTTGQLATLVEKAMPAAVRRKRKLHPATKVFQALRMAVNDELGQLRRFLDDFPNWLSPGGRVVILSYHSLEDRMVKRAFRTLASPCNCPPGLPVCACGRKPLLRLLNPKVQRPGEAEVKANPRARSARLRWAERTTETGA